MTEPTASTSDDRRQPKVVRRGRGRPRKVQPEPNTKGLPGLPVEIIGRIASFLLPSPVTTTHGFAPPTELPYGNKEGIKQVSKRYTYGGIPSGVSDALRLAITCKRCEKAVSLVMGKVGNASTTHAKSTLFINLPDEPPIRHTGSQSDVDASKCSKLFHRISESQATLETLVFYRCPHESRSCEIQYPLNFITPFQETSTIFQRLKSLQLGPDLCHICLLAVLHLFCSKRFQIDAQESGPNGRLTRGHHHLGFNRREGDTVDSAAAPNLSHLCVYLDAFGGRHSNTQGDLSALTRHIAHPEKIQMLQLWLHELQELGGMSSGGNILHLAPRNTKDVEKELTDWAEQELAKQKSAQDVLLAKFAAQAKSVLPKPRRTGVDSKDGSTVSEAAAESDETDSDEVNAKGEVDDKPASPDPSSSRHSRSTGTSSDSDGLLRRKATASSLTYEGCLEIIAKTFPNLVGLSLLRRRQLRPAILEGVTSLDKFGQSFVEPLAKLQHLRHLDLGLAVVTKSEVVDFPSGLSLSNTRHGRKIAKDVDSALQALKRRKYTLDMDRARAEGDKWRKAILDRYVDASADSPDEPEVDRSHDDASRAEASASPSRDDTDVKWPKTLRSGHLIMPDLENRVRGNGLMVPWWVEGQKVVVGEPVRMRL